MRMDLGLVGLAGCLSDWILSRPWKPVLLCFLPLIFAFSTIGLVAASSWLDRDKLADRYLKLADQEVAAWEKQWAPDAREAGDSDTTSKDASTLEASTDKAASAKPVEIPASAEMLFRRVQQLQQNDPRSMFFVAMCYLQRGAGSQALNMLNRIAPNDRVGYLPAHALLAENLLSQPIQVADLPVIKHHAEAAMRWDRASPHLLSLISELFDKLGETDKSVSTMRQAASRDPKHYLTLVELSQKDKKYSKLGEESIEKASAHYAAQLAKNPQDINARLTVAEIYRLQSDIASAEKTLLDGLNLADNQLLKSALSELYRQAFLKTSRVENNSWTGNIELLDKAYRLDPNNLRIYEVVAKLAAITGSVEDDGELMAQLRANLAAGRATSVTHTWIAEHFLRTKQFAQAIPHLEQAVQRDPTASRCWNNLAYCLADVAPERLEEALKCANQAVMLNSDVPDFHDTRGSILMKMKKPGEAIAAFERAIEAAVKPGSQFPPQPDYHLRLADAYAEAGDKSMADTHKQFAAKLKETIEKSRAMNAQPNAAPSTQPNSQDPASKASPKNPNPVQEGSAAEPTESDPTPKP